MTYRILAEGRGPGTRGGRWFTVARVAEVVGGGMLFALGAGRGFLAHRESDGGLHVYTALQAPEDWLDGIDLTDTAAAEAAVLEHFADWDKSLRALVADADGALVPRRILPTGHRWGRVPGVTLLDGAELGLAVAAHLGDTEAALAAYEEKLFPRSENSAVRSAEGGALLFRADAPQGLVDMFGAHDG